jgi:isopenicillin N synthase-like dioxygenase
VGTDDDDGDVFDGAFGDRPSTLIKLIRYPGREERGQGVGAHHDPGVLTLFMIEPGQGGLQVETGHGWLDAPAGTTPSSSTSAS